MGSAARSIGLLSVVFSWLAAASLAEQAHAQTSYPMITHMHPVAVQRGRTTEVTVEGQMNFLGVYKALFEGAGLTAEVVPHEPPKAVPPAKPQVKSVKLKITAAPDAALGVREFRLASSLGISSIGQLLVVDDPVVVEQGVLIGRYRKAHLLSGERIFDAGSESSIFEVDGLRFGINICYDTNFSQAAREVANLGASLIVCPANNMHRRKTAEALKDMHNSVRGERCRETGLWLVSADVTGKRDGRISWGPTAVLNPAGEVVAQLPLEKTGLLVFDIPCRL